MTKLNMTGMENLKLIRFFLYIHYKVGTDSGCLEIIYLVRSQNFPKN